MAWLTSSQFMLALPGATRRHLPRELSNFKAATRGWLCQLYYHDPRLHYEVWNLGERRGLLEIGLHFESRDHAANEALLRGFDRHMVEVKAALGPQWEAERWDKGWTKVYETIPYEPFSDKLLEVVSKRLAKAMVVLQPIWEKVEPGRVEKRRG
jgi:hypothetical protein